MQEFLAFVAALVAFHVSEFAFAAWYHPNDVSRKSWLFSYPYVAAMCLGCVEHMAVWYCLPAMHYQAVSRVGLCMVVIGELVRKTGMMTAQHNFSHDIKVQRAERHVLVTRGIYRWMRHPGYSGWLIWSVGTQVLLGNPVCTCLFTYLSWRFFQQRIQWEDSLLLRFFDEEFLRYKQSVPSGIPFIP